MKLCDVLTGMFERHKMLYSFQMAMKLEQSHGNMTQKELEFFIQGSACPVKAERISSAKWITTQVSNTTRSNT
jgi:dynein heavy chain